MRTRVSPINKQLAISALSQLKRHLYAQAAASVRQNPQKADIIRKRVDHDASHIAFSINMLRVKI